jgi:GT2 family glycosyltransferase
MIRARRVGVVVLDHGRPADAERAAASARDPRLDVRVLIVENGSLGGGAAGVDRLRLSENRGFAGGMNAGIEQLQAAGCERFVLLNNDAVLGADCLLRLTEALEEPALAAVGPLILAESDGKVESRGLRVDLRWGRVRLQGSGEAAGDRDGLTAADALSGAVIMISRAAVERVGLLDTDYFFGFEDVDWCLRARRAGFGLAVVNRATARHAGSSTLGRSSPDRIYYAVRNHLRCAETHDPLGGGVLELRRCTILGLNLAHALRQRDVPLVAAVRATCEGFRDARCGRFGPKAPTGQKARARGHGLID